MEELKKLTIEQLLDSEDYQKELEVQIKNEMEHHDHMAREAFTKGLRLQMNPHTRLRDREVFNVKDLVELYKRIICKTLVGFAASEREYIKQVCMMAYWRTIEKLKKKD